MSKIEVFIIKLFKRIGLVVARQSTVNRDAEIIRDKYIKIGKKIGILEVLRYNQKTLSDVKFQESAKHFDFETLDKEYPYNPLLEKPHGNQRFTP